MAAFSAGSLVVFGGEHIDKPGAKKKDHKLNDLWAFVPASNKWDHIAKSDCEVRLAAGIQKMC